MLKNRITALLSVSALMVASGGLALAQQTGEGQQAAQAQQESKISLVAGHNVVDAVDDVRETVADLANAIRNASETAEFAAWEAEPLQETAAELAAMETRLDRKAEETDSSWLNWLEDRDFSVTVKSEIHALGNTLNRIASVMEGAEGNPGLQVVTGHNIVDQVDDTRETVADLVNAIGDAGPEWGWFDETEVFPQFQAQLEDMESTLDQKAEMTDAEWQGWVQDPEYQVYVQEQIRTLGRMLNEISGSIQA